MVFLLNHLTLTRLIVLLIILQWDECSVLVSGQILLRHISTGQLPPGHIHPPSKHI